MCDAKACPASAPPVRQLITPAGMPASMAREARNSRDKGLFSLTFMIMVLPQASAGATFMAKIVIGALKAQMPAHTPRGWWGVYYSLMGQLPLQNHDKFMADIGEGQDSGLTIISSSVVVTMSLENLSIMFPKPVHWSAPNLKAIVRTAGEVRTHM